MRGIGVVSALLPAEGSYQLPEVSVRSQINEIEDLFDRGLKVVHCKPPVQRLEPLPSDQNRAQTPTRCSRQVLRRKGGLNQD